ncbi:hypothetical protein PEC730217_22620 [Pectobacterium carotovorum subsp. carotovorum]|nr:hypothetical protein PEC730217_22620 [Pectobacterium carotovorum subsp. carotovorum]
MNTLMVPDVSLPTNNLKKFLKTISWIAFSCCRECLNHRVVTPDIGLIGKDCPAQ